MASVFESIFTTDSHIDHNLNKLFTREIKINKNPTEEKIEESEADIKQLKGSKKDPKKIKKSDLESEKRTIFIGNLQVDCKKEELIKIFKTYGKIEAVRFRNIVPEDITKAKKYAFITKQHHPNKKSINGYVRFKNEESAINAAKEMNGMEYRSRHLRVDVANKSKIHDNKCSVFLGALAFDVVDEKVYQHFESCGEIVNVRIIRDNQTGVGKGFGYIQFKTSDSLELALKLDGSMIGDRKIRVSRAVKKQKDKKANSKKNQKSRSSPRSNNKFQNSKRDKNQQIVGKSQLGKIKHQKRRDEKEAEKVAGVLPVQTDSKNLKDDAKKKRISKRKSNEIKRKKIKKKHVGTNNKAAKRFNI